MTPRLASATRVNALVRLCHQAGGFAAVLRKGDETAGTIVIQTAENGRFTGLYEPVMIANGSYGWQSVGPQDIEDSLALDAYIQRRRASDPDLWVVELDIANAAHFIVEWLAEA